LLFKINENSAICQSAYEFLLTLHSNMSISCTVFKIQQDIGPKLPI